jgi:hypothetical protein
MSMNPDKTEAIVIGTSARQRVDVPACTVDLGCANVVIVTGVLRFMPIEEVWEEAGATQARRITQRVAGKLELMTAIVLSYNSQPLVCVNIHYESFRMKAYIQQTARCFHCQWWNHRQAGCKKPAKCARCGENHRTNDCKMMDNSKLKCVNRGGNHSAAAPICRDGSRGGGRPGPAPPLLAVDPSPHLNPFSGRSTFGPCVHFCDRC